MKRIREFISSLLVLCMLISMLPVSVFAETTEIASGTCGSTLTWTLDDAGTLIISGTGPMASYSGGGKVPWYGKFIKTVIIADGVENIGANAFSECDSLINVIISDSVTSIGYHAFYNCKALTDITIGGGIHSVGTDAFWNCDSLNAVYISDLAGWCNISFPSEGSNPLSWAHNLYINGELINECVIPLGVTYIGSYSFAGCSNISNIIIANSVQSIQEGAFSDCINLTQINIPESVKYIGEAAFYRCNSLSEIIIPEGISYINDRVFVSCTSLSSINIPKGVTKIGEAAFSLCSNLKSINFQDNLISIEDAAFFDCVSLEDIYYAGNEHLWSTITIGKGNDTIEKATIHYNSTGPEDGSEDIDGGHDDTSKLSISGLTIDKKHDNFYAFLGDSHIYNMNSPKAELYLELNQIAVVDNDVISPANIVWTSSDETVLRIVSSGTEEDMYVNLRVEGLTEGTATLTAANPAGETLSFDVTVVKPNALSFAKIYDTKQYYSSGAFYSAASSISDSVEIFVQFENALIDGYPCKVESDLAKNVSDVEPITLTAVVSGSDLSFDRNSYQNTYTTTYDPIKFGNYIYDILMLFPYNVDSYEAGTSYTVNLTLESDSFAEPIEETYSFTVYDAEKQRVAEHISFTNNSTYKVSKQNIYGTNMLELKGDPEYNWSVVTSFDFDNYYEIVLADLLVDMLDVYQVNTSIVPTVLKEWHGTYKSLLGDVTTMVNDSYADVLDVSEMKIDKILKVSKYTKAGDGIYADDDVYQVVLDMFGNVGNVDKIQTFFAAVDDTKSAFSIVKLTGDVVKDFVAWGNSIAVLNAFVETDENFKQVFRQVADNIPDSEKKMKEAIEDYINYSQDFAGQFAEIYDSFCDLGKDVALDTFDGIVGKKLWDWAAAKAVGWIGKIPISGGAATFSSTTAYASLTTAIGSVTTGISLGLCLSDLICDSSDKAAEMSKIIAMSEYAPYIIQALEYYEDNLYSAADSNAVDLFEKAFGLHQASQSYIMDHTVKALEVKAGSILQSILGNDDYDVLIANILVQKDAIDALKCCGQLAEGTIVNTKKVIAIKCPVNVYIYDENGVELVRIVNDTVEYVADGLKVFVQDGEKYVAMPASQVYSIKIAATDEGTMTYAVLEYNEGAQLYRTLRRTSIPLEDERIFTGVVVEPLGVEPESYALTYDNGTIIPRDVTTCNHIYANACDATCNDCGAIRTTIHTWKTPLSHNATQHWTECSVCGEKKNVEGHIGGSADCQNNAVCTDCQQPYGELTGCDFTAEKAEAKYLKSAATCKDVAVYYKSCAVCGKTGTETFTYGSIDKTNHTGGTEVRGVTAESCTVDGYTGDTHCMGCGDKLITGQLILATAHKTATTVAEVASTCKTNGVKAHFHCPVCNKDFLEKTVTAVAQTADDLKLPLNAKKHEGGTEVRNAIPMTCTDDGYTGDTYCRGCAVKIATGTAIPAEHKLDKVTANPATHDTAGNIEHYTCSVCAKLFNDDKATKELTADEVVIAKGEHSYSETFQHDENGHWKGCECGSKIEEGAHTYGEWVVTMKADVGVEGSKERTCTICGYKQTEKLPATTTPATGDNTHIGFLFILMLISACGMITILFVVPRKKGKYQH